jgi:hypothetical protein
MAARTGEPRWDAIWKEAADRVWAEWLPDEEQHRFLWTQRLYGTVRQFIGPAHGFAGNVAVLALGAALLDPERRDELERRAVATAWHLAVRADGLANWPPLSDGVLAGGDGVVRVQWCHGAPGIVTSAAALPRDDALDDLLLAGGELTWAAGPLRKGPGLCHGSAGNGFAFLKLFERTQDERWLERARRFAVHAAAQVEATRREHGRGRYSLWTGDLGAAIYLHRCLAGGSGMPGLDAW